MLERVDRVQLVVKDRQAAARTFGDLLGAQVAREERSDYLGISRTTAGWEWSGQPARVARA